LSDDQRQAFAVPLAEGEYDDIELSLLDRDDEDDRRLSSKPSILSFTRLWPVDSARSTSEG
jgi:hypothetical protein